MLPFAKPIIDGSPWIDYQEAEKTGYESRFFFTIENLKSFILREVCISYRAHFQHPEAGGLMQTQLPLKVSIEIISSRANHTPVPVPPQLFSSPNEIFRAGILNEDASGQRLNPVRFNIPCRKGDVIIINVTGDAVSDDIDPSPLIVGCMITGRKYGG